MTSDILMIFKNALSEDETACVRTALMEVGRSVLIHQKEGQERLFLIKFDPLEVAPAHLLEAARATGLDPVIAGG